jgi:hypothetical protein
MIPRQLTKRIRTTTMLFSTLRINWTLWPHHEKDVGRNCPKRQAGPRRSKAPLVSGHQVRTIIVWLDERECIWVSSFATKKREPENSALTWTNERGSLDHSALDSGEGNPDGKTGACASCRWRLQAMGHCWSNLRLQAPRFPEPIRKLVIDALTLYPNDPIAPAEKPALSPEVRSEPRGPSPSIRFPHWLLGLLEKSPLGSP